MRLIVLISLIFGTGFVGAPASLLLYNLHCRISIVIVVGIVISVGAAFILGREMRKKERGQEET